MPAASSSLTDPAIRQLVAAAQCVEEGGPPVAAVRFSEGLPGPHESTTGRLSRSDYISGHLGVHGRPYASTAVVSTALARLESGVSGPRSLRPACPVLLAGVPGCQCW